MNLSIRAKPHQVNFPRTSLGGADSLNQNLVPEKCTLGNLLVDAGNLLIDYPTGAEIQMPDFGIPHLPLG
jgi:hypothetical protein